MGMIALMLLMLYAALLVAKLTGTLHLSWWWLIAIPVSPILFVATLGGTAAVIGFVQAVREQRAARRAPKFVKGPHGFVRG